MSDNVEWAAATLTATQNETDEMRQLVALFAELERELGESDDPDLRFAAAFAKQCAICDTARQDGWRCSPL